jgi:hypothetical protein
MKYTEHYFLIQTIIFYIMLSLPIIIILITLIIYSISSLYDRIFKNNCNKCKHSYLKNTPYWYNCNKRNDLKNWKCENNYNHYEKCNKFERK